MRPATRHHPPWGGWRAGSALALLLLLASPASAYLSYTLSSELKKSACSNDTDGDCLDNTEEGNLAWAVAPWYFYDEDEGCSGLKNRFGLPSYHFARQDFFQVRPDGTGIRDWSATDGKAKWVRLTYFLAFPHDCREGFGGHQGDGEHIYLDLYSYDLKTWYLASSRYYHHNDSHVFSGTYQESRAQALGTSWISIAGDQNSHGSWPGNQASSSHCAGAEDDVWYCSTMCDCFHSTWANDLRNGPVEVVQANRNIGGPPPYESWNASVLSVSGSTAWTDMDVGHGLNREYWSDQGGTFQQFCGWECPSAYRQSDGNCARSVHEQSGCSTKLWEKVDKRAFSLDSGSCVGNCGGSAGSCYCDSSCVTYGDCCPDACSACGSC